MHAARIRAEETHPTKVIILSLGSDDLSVPDPLLLQHRGPAPDAARYPAPTAAARTRQRRRSAQSGFRRPMELFAWAPRSQDNTGAALRELCTPRLSRAATH